MIKIDSLSVKAKDGVELLSDISFNLEKGKILGLTGASGSGKTTLLRTIMGNLAPNHRITEGTVYIDSENIISMSKKEHRNLCGVKIGYIPQNPMTAFDNRIKVGNQLNEILCFKKSIKKEEANFLIIEKLHELHLNCDVLENYPSSLSGGMLQRIIVALLLVLSPDYILADEPTSALDEKNAEILVKLLEKESRNRGVLFVSHDVLSMKKLCNELIILENGYIIEQDLFDELISNPKNNWTKAFSKHFQERKENSFKWKKL